MSMSENEKLLIDLKYHQTNALGQTIPVSRGKMSHMVKVLEKVVSNEKKPPPVYTVAVGSGVTAVHDFTAVLDRNIFLDMAKDYFELMEAAGRNIKFWGLEELKKLMDKKDARMKQIDYAEGMKISRATMNAVHAGVKPIDRITEARK